MKKLMALAVFLLLLPGTALAHTGLEKAVPGDNETVENEVKEITLNFETEIEPLSTFEVVNEKGEKAENIDIQAKGNQLIGTLPEPLPEGKYTVNWKIVGEDGHPVEGSYSFQVKSATSGEGNSAEKDNPAKNSQEANAPQDANDPKAATAQQNANAPAETTTASSNGNTQPAQPAAAEHAAKTEGEAGFTPLTVAILCTLLAVVILCGVELRGQRKK